MAFPHPSHEICCPSPEQMNERFGVFMTEHADAQFYHDVAARLATVMCEVAFSCGGYENYLIAARVKRGENAMDCSLIVSDEALEFARGAFWASFLFEGFEVEIAHSDCIKESRMTIEEQEKETRALLAPFPPREPLE